MAFTVQEVIDMGRIPLNDANKTRMSDATALVFFKQAMLMLQSKRPDMFFGRFLAMPDVSAMTLATVFPVEDIIAPAVADYITARAESGNDESIVEQRAQLFLQLFKGQV